MIILAYDPGDVWCGCAALWYDGRTERLTAETRVLHIPGHGRVGTVHSLVRAPLKLLRGPVSIVAEDYRVRPMGHQHWSSGLTLRMLGMIEYEATEHERATWATLPPGNAKRELPELSGNFFDRWRTLWPDGGNPEWNHAESAWRICFRYLMKHDSALLMRLRTKGMQESFTQMTRWLPLTHRVREDLVAPAAAWQMPLSPG